MEAPKNFDVWDIGVVRHYGVEMLFRVFFVLRGIVMRMVGKDNHAVWVFAAVLLLDLVEQLTQQRRRGIVRPRREKAIRSMERQIGIEKNHQRMRRILSNRVIDQSSEPQPYSLVRFGLPRLP